MAKRDYYEVLGVAKTATADEIKSAYRKKAKECHPDLHPGDKTAEERFKELNEANEVLSNPEKRKRYDQFGFEDPGAGFDASGFGGSAGFDMGDIFSSIFGGGAGMGGMGGRAARSNGPVPGNDLQFKQTITFEEAYRGCKKSIEFYRNELCESCSGSGAKPGSQSQTCTHCNGTGQIRSGNGFFMNISTCPYCKGEGKIIKDKCTSCGGTGRVRKKRTITINIPAGIEDGMTLKEKGAGEPGLRGGPAGDFYITISIRPHKLFRREGSNVLLDMPITMTQAALGAEIDVPTMNKPEKLKIPEGTQYGTKFKIRGQGFKSLRNGTNGDQIVTVSVEIPKGLRESQKSYLRDFDKTINGREYPDVRTFEGSTRDLMK